MTENERIIKKFTYKKGDIKIFKNAEEAKKYAKENDVLKTQTKKEEKQCHLSATEKNALRLWKNNYKRL